MPNGFIPPPPPWWLCGVARIGVLLLIVILVVALIFFGVIESFFPFGPPDEMVWAAGIIAILAFFVFVGLAGSQVCLWLSKQRVLAAFPRFASILAIFGISLFLDFLAGALTFFYVLGTGAFLVGLVLITLDPPTAGALVLVGGVLLLIVIPAMLAKGLCNWLACGSASIVAAGATEG